MCGCRCFCQLRWVPTPSYHGALSEFRTAGSPSASKEDDLWDQLLWPESWKALTLERVPLNICALVPNAPQNDIQPLFKISCNYWCMDLHWTHLYAMVISGHRVADDTLWIHHPNYSGKTMINEQSRAETFVFFMLKQSLHSSKQWHTGYF